MKNPKKKSGLVKKVKGYANGGYIDPKLNTYSPSIAAGSALATGAGSLIDATNNPNDAGMIDANKAALSGGLKAAGKGASLGATIGSVVPGVGTLIGGGIGLLAGGTLGAIKGFRDADKSNSDINTLNEEENLAEINAKNSTLFNSNLANQLASRNSYSKGGKVVGKGTGTSDSIKAKVKEGSHIVPKKNAKVAEVIRKEVLGEDENSKADLNQDKAIAVKLSNGEHLFTPEEVEEIEANGIDLDDLSPDAQNDLRGYMNKGGKVKGYAKGGGVEKPDTKNIKDGKTEEYLSKVESLYALRNKALADKDPANKAKNEAILKYTKGKIDSLDATYKTGTIDRSSPEKYQQDLAKKLGIEIPKTSTTSVTGKGLSNSLSSKVPISKSSNASESLAETMANQDIDNAITAPTSGLAKGVSAAVTKGDSAIDDAANLAPYEAELATRLAETTPSTTPNYSAIGSGLSTALNYGVPLLQTGIGLNYLRKAGDRPVDSIDPNYQISLNNADNRAANAYQRASYGFTPEEQAVINNNNANVTASQRFGARNYSGGSAANAYGMERSALNDSFGRGLASSVANRQLQLQKQREADNIAASADNLRLQKVDLSRRLFNDKLTGWQQSQQAGANLVGTGLSNLVGAGRYEAEKRAIANRTNIDNSYLNGI